MSQRNQSQLNNLRKFKMYPLILNKVFNHTWLIEPETHKAIQQTLLSHIQDNDIKLNHGSVSSQDDKPYYLAGDTAIINMFGVVGKYLSNLEMACGGLSLDSSLNLIEKAAADSEVKNILLNFDSPGGTDTGVFEFSKRLSDLTQLKPIYAFTETKMCSAAYWMASKCTGIIATPSAKVGSIGVYMAMLDSSQKSEREGVKMYLFEAGKHKAVGLRPPTEEEVKMIQKRVDDLHTQFKTEVNEKRAISDEYMEGLVYSGQETIESGLVDSLVYSLSEALEIIK